MKIITVLLLLLFSEFTYSSEQDYINGIEYYKNKKFLMAIGSFKKVLESGKQDEKIYFYLGNCYAFIENYDKALESLKISGELAEDLKFKSIVIHNIGYVYYLKKDYKKSINYLNQAYQINTNLNQVFWYKGMAYFKLKDKENTISEWEKYLELEPDGKESDNIRKALAILKAKDFSFEKDEGKIMVEISSGEKGGEKIEVMPLIDVEGVLEEIKPEDKGKLSDEALEEIEK
ncbi:MAG: tetratricopeptide repeat protein [Brevinematia bacterium]